jgi:hypothetical protein
MGEAHQTIYHTVQQAVQSCTAFETQEAMDAFNARAADIGKLANESPRMVKLVQDSTGALIQRVLPAMERADMNLFGQAVAGSLGQWMLLGIMIGIEMAREPERKVII